MKGLCSLAKAGSSREMMDFLFDRFEDRNHDNRDEEEDDDDVLLFLVLLLPLPLLRLLAGDDVLVVVEEDDDDEISLFPELAVDRSRPRKLHLPRLIMVMLVVCSLGYY